MKIKINDYKIFDAIRPDVADLVESLLCRVDVRGQIPQIGDLLDRVEKIEDSLTTNKNTMKTIEDLQFEIKQLKAIIREQARQLKDFESKK